MATIDELRARRPEHFDTFVRHMVEQYEKSHYWNALQTCHDIMQLLILEMNDVLKGRMADDATPE